MEESTAEPDETEAEDDKMESAQSVRKKVLSSRLKGYEN